MLLLWFFTSTFLNRAFYMDTILPLVYPEVVQEISQYVLQQNNVLSSHFDEKEIRLVIEETISLQDTKEIADQFFSALEKELLTDLRDTSNAVTLTLTRYKENFESAMERFLESYISGLPPCGNMDDLQTFSCRPLDISDEALQVYISGFIDIKAIFHDVPEVVHIQIPQITLPPLIVYLDNIERGGILLLFILVLCILAFSYRNIKSFFKKQGCIFIGYGLFFFILSYALHEYFNYTRYSLEQEMNEGKQYVEIFYNIYTASVKERLFFLALSLFCMGVLLFSVFVILKVRSKKVEVQK